MLDYTFSSFPLAAARALNPVSTLDPAFCRYVVPHHCPQRKRQKAHDKMITELKSGDSIVTSGGIRNHHPGRFLYRTYRRQCENRLTK